MREPTITINGHTLTEAQAMTVRVAMRTVFVDFVKQYASSQAPDDADLYNRLSVIASGVISMMAEEPQ